MRLTFYGGIREVGGNKILLEDKKTAIFLDFGKSFQQASKYFEEYLNPRVVHGMKDYLVLGLLPFKQRIYREDLIYILHQEKEKQIRSFKKSVIDGVLLSHGHLDHAGYISFLDPQIPIYASKDTIAVLKAFSVSRPKILENEILEISLRQIQDPRKRKKRKRNFRVIENLLETPLEFIPTKTRKGIKQKKIKLTKKRIGITRPSFFIKNLEIVPLAIDHSLPGANMFLIKTSIGNILYSGDFRLSELKPKERKELCVFLKNSKIKIFLCEGTRIKEQSILTEKNVYKKALQNVSKIKGLVVADYSIGDVVRFKTLLKIAKKTKRLIALPYNYFNYLNTLNEEGVLKKAGIAKKDFENIVLYAKRKIYFKKWEKDLLKKHQVCTAEDIKKHKNRYILILNFYQVQELIDLKVSKRSYYLRAITEPHSEEMEISEERFINWIKHFEMQGLKEDINNPQKKIFERAHISGHISGKELAEFIKAIQPETVIPIHTEFPEEFKKMHKKVMIVEKNDYVDF